ncbi:hypothetical protein L2E82_49339 [Cichorium intybus]|uniref:Uncharacterized protein n=1 Tax=Cichorium intybus TaxID=13427 RepID=A0ACB8Z187_CICIN|nr:hypothetical protein L2E82_49339 [Cichorium intybus]
MSCGPEKSAFQEARTPGGIRRIGGRLKSNKYWRCGGEPSFTPMVESCCGNAKIHCRQGRHLELRHRQEDGRE